VAAATADTQAARERITGLKRLERAMLIAPAA
jgi:hypothetical protein